MKEPFSPVVLHLNEQNQNQSTEHHIELPRLCPVQGHPAKGLNEGWKSACVPLAKPYGLHETVRR